MDLTRLKKPLTQYLDRLAQQIQVEQLIVFGSYLEGTARVDSDIDVFVISDDFTGLTEDQRWQILYPAARLIEPDIDAWGFTKAELKQASQLTTLGYARDQGVRFHVSPG